MTFFFRFVLALLICVVTPCLAAAQTDSTQVPENSSPLRLSLQPKPPSETDMFFITEVGMLVSPEVVDLQDIVYGPNYMIIWDVGVMKNMSSRIALGASLGFTQGNDSPEFSVALKPRFRYWLSDHVPLDISPGITILNNADENGPKPRFLVDAAISYRDWLGLTTRILTTHVEDPSYFPEGPLRTEPFTETELYAGVRLGGYPGLIGGGAIAAAWAILSAIFPED